jgi:putative transposase
METIMANTHTNLLMHIVFSTHRREPTIASGVETALHAYIGVTVRTHGGEPVAIGGTYDHVHVLAAFPAALPLADVVRSIKGSSSSWMNAQRLLQGHFEWQAGYGAFSVSEESRNAVKAYIQGQKERHRTCTFREEYVDLLERNRIAYDERYLWD